MGLYGKVTPDLMRRVLEACGKERKPWARPLVYLVDKVTDGDRLGAVEAAWLSDWMEREGIDDPGSVLTVQITRSQVADEVFGGQQTTAQRAVDKLVELGILRLIRKGKKGHGSLYFVSFVEGASLHGSFPQKDTKTGGNVTLSNDELGHVFSGLGHISDGLGHISGPATCGNADVFKVYSEINSKKEKEMESGNKAVCPRCGDEAIPYANGTMLDCRRCGGMRATAKFERMKADARINRIKGGEDASAPLTPFINASTGETTSYL